MEKAWLFAHGLSTSEEKWRDLRSSIKQTETLSNMSFLSQFKCFEKCTSKHCRGRHCLNPEGCSGQPWHSTGSADGEVAGLACVISGLFKTHMGKLQQNQGFVKLKPLNSSIKRNLKSPFTVAVVGRAWSWRPRGELVCAG